LHRIEESTLRQELEAAGFKLVATGDFWRNAADTHDFPSFTRDKPVDNFELKFQKPCGIPRALCFYIRSFPRKRESSFLGPRPAQAHHDEAGQPQVGLRCLIAITE